MTREEALAAVRSALTAESKLATSFAEALADIERLVAKFELMCVRSVAEAREAGRTMGLEEAARAVAHVVMDEDEYGEYGWRRTSVRASEIILDLARNGSPLKIVGGA